MSDAELLAIFLRIGVSGKSAVDLARELLIRFEAGNAIHDSNIGSGTHRAAAAGLQPEHQFWWLPINVGGTGIGYRILKALRAKHPTETTL